MRRRRRRRRRRREEDGEEGGGGGRGGGGRRRRRRRRRKKYVRIPDPLKSDLKKKCLLAVIVGSNSTDSIIFSAI